MSLLSCLVYIVANVVLMVMLWLYHRSRRRQQLTRRSEADEGLDQAFQSAVTVSRTQISSPSTGVLSVLGLRENRTFFNFEDHFSTFEEVAAACTRSGLENCQLIVGVDFSASNEWQGRKTFGGNSLHKVVAGRVLNPYQRVIASIGRTLEYLSSDSFIPAFGFADKETKSEAVFSFTSDPRGCQGFGEVLERYDRVAPELTLGGPTNFAPIIKQAMRIVTAKKSYHILLIIADGQVNEYEPTVQALVEASRLPLSIVMLGVGDGPWDAMEHFDDKLPQRHFDNFQFVNFHKVTAKKKNPDPNLALHVMMEIPDQYKTIKTLGYLQTDEERAEKKKAKLEEEQKKKKKGAVEEDGSASNSPSTTTALFSLSNVDTTRQRRTADEVESDAPCLVHDDTSLSDSGSGYTTFY